MKGNRMRAFFSLNSSNSFYSSKKPHWLLLLAFLFSACGEKQSDIIPYIQDKPFSFFVAGHIYGNYLHVDSSNHPFPPFSAQVPYLNTVPNLELGFLLGDMVFNPDPESYSNLNALLSQIEADLYFSPGNHETRWFGQSPITGEFDSNFGDRYGSFRHKKNLFLVFDSNQYPWRIEGRQMEMLSHELANLEWVNNIFCFSHNILWYEEDSTSIHHQALPNSLWNMGSPLNFWSEVVPLFQNLKQNVYFFAGDTGANCNGAEVTYYHTENLHLISSGMGCSRRSNYLLVHVSQDGETEIELIGIGSEEMGTIEDQRYQ